LLAKCKQKLTDAPTKTEAVTVRGIRYKDRYRYRVYIEWS